ncbi:hypothetical protein ASD79_22070 [Caulobacter sp. Root655]|nr:hypothetical protein ASD79_22070 [Caulobacter sp. Root655]
MFPALRAAMMLRLARSGVGAFHGLASNERLQQLARPMHRQRCAHQLAILDGALSRLIGVVFRSAHAWRRPESSGSWRVLP